MPRYYNNSLPTTRSDDDDRVPFSALIRRACWRVRRDHVAFV